MKTKNFLSCVALVVLCSWTNPAQPEFLVLNSTQLKSLGIVLNEDGVFYKNFNPAWKQDNAVYSCLSFYCCSDNYLTTGHYAETDVITAKTRDQKALLKLETSRNDFYPLLIGNTKGEMSLDDETLAKDMKLFPVAICMSETKLRSRTDTVVVWFKPSDALQKALPAGIKMKDFLKTRPEKKK